MTRFAVHDTRAYMVVVNETRPRGAEKLLRLRNLQACAAAALCLAACAAQSGPAGHAGAAGSAPASAASTAPVSTAPADVSKAAAMSQPSAPVVQMSKQVSSDDCNKVAIDFARKVPAVFLLVDRSSSMFETSRWEPLKKGVLAVVKQLEGDIRFGFTSYTGERDKMCPQLSMLVPVASKNYSAIERAYNAVVKPQFKGETPTSLALTEVSHTLLQEPEDAPKYILLVTDGEPDFCDDPNVTCSRDAVVAAVQEANGLGVGTFIFGIGGEVEKSHLADVANAGVGLPVEDHQMAVQYQCPMKRGTYSSTPATQSAPYFEPDVNDQQALVTALTAIIAGVRSCVFDLQGKLKIDLSLADQGLVTIDNQPVPFGTPDGFRMNSPTQLELLGAACMKVKQPQTLRVAIDFPCKAIELF